MDDTLLDTDTLSEILKGKNARVMEAGDRYLADHERFAFSAVTFYEVLRGLRANQAVRSLVTFRKLADESEILPVSIPVLTRAADLWAEALHGGYPRNDADSHHRGDCDRNPAGSGHRECGALWMDSGAVFGGLAVCVSVIAPYRWLASTSHESPPPCASSICCRPQWLAGSAGPCSRSTAG